MNYYYSNWNRHNRSLWRKILDKIKGFMSRVWHYFKSEKIMRRRLTMFCLYAVAFFLLAGSITFALVSLSLPDPNKLNSRIIPQSTKIYARDGTTLLYEIHGEAKRTLIPLSEMPDSVKQAAIAVEDKNFYRNPGIDWRGILRSLFVDITSGSASQGGSTITQQFVRNAILTREKTVIRKIKEVVLAIEIGQKFSKDQILQLYLNEIPYGQNAYGVEAAAQTYFGVHARDLNLAQSAYLAALPQAPSFYNANRDKLENRKNIVLDLMFEQGYIGKEQKDNAKTEKTAFKKTKDAILSPHFVLYVQGQLAEKYGEKTLEEGGLKVTTTLDWNLQQIADKAVKDGAAKNEKNNKARNAALVAIDPKTGHILAMVGSREYFDDSVDGQVNVALSERQPGSSIKPYIYATAFKQGMSPSTMLVDVKTNFGTYGGKEYSPNNYDNENHGIVSIRKALAGSLNIPAVKTLALVGVANAIETAKDMGITSDISVDKCGLSLVLGGCEIKLIDHVSAMGVFANGGIKQEQISILKIEDSKGNVLEEYQDKSGERVLDPQIAYEIVSIMTDNEARSFIFGGNSPLILPGRPVGAKTGTTQSWRDGWTIGYTPSMVAGVWVGNNDATPMRQGADGVIVAAPIWHQFMAEALKGTPPEQFMEPAGIQHVVVDAVSGKLPTDYTILTKTEIFAENSLPKDFDDVHVPVRINKLNGKKASGLTPPDALETKIFTVIHSEKPDNPDWENAVQSWAISAGFVYPPTEPDDGSVAKPNFNIVFLTPNNNQTILTLPFAAQVSVNGTVPLSVDLLLNGILVGSKSSSPFSFNVSKLNKGANTISAVAHLPDGSTTQNSIQINY